MSLLTMAPPMLSDLPSSTGSQLPHQTNVNVQNPGPSKVPSTSSLLFGFLISFLAFFIIFMGCGLASRYMMDRRRQRVASGPDLLHVGAGGSGKPELWDVWAVPGHEEWKDMMPLSVELRRIPAPPPPIRRGLTPAEQLLHMYHGFGRRSFSSASPSHRTPSRDSVLSTSQGSRIPEAEGPVDLQIAVLVVMPSSASRTRDHTHNMSGRDTPLKGHEHRQDNDAMSNVAVGITAIPWDKEGMDFG